MGPRIGKAGGHPGWDARTSKGTHTESYTMSSLETPVSLGACHWMETGVSGGNPKGEHASWSNKEQREDSNASTMKV